MPNTYTQLHIHLVFAVKNRAALISKAWRDELEKYITELIQKDAHKLLAIYAMRDHIHIFIGYNPVHLIPKLVESVKSSSTNWIKREKLIGHDFSWQRGYGAFAHSKSQVSAVCNYIHNQETHHAKKTFRAECLEMLEKNEIDYDEKYLFEFFDDLYQNE